MLLDVTSYDVANYSFKNDLPAIIPVDAFL